MMEIYDKYQNLLDVIKNSDIKYRALDITKKIQNDNELLNMINKYHLCPSKTLEEKINKNKNYQALKQIETEINILIMQINFKFKHLKKGRDKSESNKR